MEEKEMLNEKRIGRRILTVALVLLCATSICFADPATPATANKPAQNLTEVVQPIADLIQEMLAPILLVVGAVGSLYCVLLGVKYARAEEPQDREKAKAHLKGAIIGFVLIFVLIVLLRFLLPYLNNWAQTVEIEA